MFVKQVHHIYAEKLAAIFDTHKMQYVRTRAGEMVTFSISEGRINASKAFDIGFTLANCIKT